MVPPGRRHRSPPKNHWSLNSLDAAANVAHLAQPGQYTAAAASPGDSSWWSDRRFSNEVVNAMNEAIDSMLAESGGNKINLIGYSGGAAIAVLIASRRTDVNSLRSVAGNLDPEGVSRHHRVRPLMGSLNPMDIAGSLRGLPQRHFVGSKDAVIPPFVAQSFMKRAGSLYGREITIVEGANHVKRWREKWKSLLTVPLQ